MYKFYNVYMRLSVFTSSDFFPSYQFAPFIFVNMQSHASFTKGLNVHFDGFPEYCRTLKVGRKYVQR